MYTYRVILDAFNSRSAAPGARVVTYTRGHTRRNALRRIGTIHISSAGAVSDGLTLWPGTRNMPTGTITARTLPEWELVSIRAVNTPATPRILWETA